MKSFSVSVISRIIFFFLFAMMIGCKETDQGQEPKENERDEGQAAEVFNFVDFIEEKGEVLFFDSDPGGVMSIGGDLVYCKLLFKKNQKVEFVSAAYNIYDFTGRYKVVGDTISIELDRAS